MKKTNNMSPFSLSANPGLIMPYVSMVVFVGLMMIQAAGRTASWLSGYGWAGPDPLGADYFKPLFTNGGPAGVWSHVPSAVIYIVLALYLAAAVALMWILVRVLGGSRQKIKRISAKDAAEYMAMPEDLKRVTLPEVQKTAVRLRPQTLKGVVASKVRPDQAGLLLGKLLANLKVWLCATWEDTIIAVMPPRTGKTSAIAVPAVVGAPGSVIVTSNKHDIWQITAGIRHKQTGAQPWVFDPMGITPVEQEFCWNPLAGLSDITAATALARHFTAGTKSEVDPFWGEAAKGLLAALMLAAATQGWMLDHVQEWLSDSDSPEPVDILFREGFTQVARDLAAKMDTAPDTKEGIWQTARVSVQCLNHPSIKRWLCPDTPPKMWLNPEELMLSDRETIYLLSADDHGGAQPVVAALTERLMKAAQERAKKNLNGRLDPPLTVVLDEAANICRIPELPNYMSHFGSKGLSVIVILQSRAQGRDAWGGKFEAMWNASTVKLIGPGVDDQELLDSISRVSGERDDAVESVSSNHGNGAASNSVSRSVRSRPILPVDTLRALPEGTAVLLVTGGRPAIIQLVPWYSGPRSAEIEACTKETKALFEGGTDHSSTVVKL